MAESPRRLLGFRTASVGRTGCLCIEPENPDLRQRLVGALWRPVDATAQRQFFAAPLGTSSLTANCPTQQEKAIRMTAATDRSQLLRAVADAKRAVEENPRPETYRALLEAQSELQRYDLTHGRNRLVRELPNRTRQSKLRA